MINFKNSDFCKLCTEAPRQSNFNSQNSKFPLDMLILKEKFFIILYPCLKNRQPVLTYYMYQIFKLSLIFLEYYKADFEHKYSTDIYFFQAYSNEIFCPVGLLSFAETANRAEKQQSQEATKKNFNSANLILMSIGKSGIIKFEFQTTQVSQCQT